MHDIWVLSTAFPVTIKNRHTQGRIRSYAAFDAQIWSCTQIPAAYPLFHLCGSNEAELKTKSREEIPKGRGLELPPLPDAWLSSSFGECAVASSDLEWLVSLLTFLVFFFVFLKNKKFSGSSKWSFIHLIQEWLMDSSESKWNIERTNVIVSSFLGTTGFYTLPVLFSLHILLIYVNIYRKWWHLSFESTQWLGLFLALICVDVHLSRHSSLQRSCIWSFSAAECF